MINYYKLMKLVVTEQIADYLVSKDEDFRNLISKYGLVEPDLYDDLFASIVFHIVGQMLSQKAARKIYLRFVDKCNNSITPSTISSLNVEEIKDCGMSIKKASWIHELSIKCLSKEINLNDVYKMSDGEAVSFLSSINGVGVWTAEMLILFSLGRENVFSYNDVALRNGIIKVKKYKTLSKKRFETLRKIYSPYCSYAALYFYLCNDDKMY